MAPLLMFPVVAMSLALADPALSAESPSAAPLPAAPGATLAPLPSVIDAARTAHLGHDPQWLSLLHYDRGLVTFHGLVDDPRFWLSPRGKHDPQAELEATLAGLWSADPAQPEQAVAARFPARATFLAQRLGFSLRDLPVASSPELDKTLADLGARKAFLVFPAGYLRSPASMFGHTLLLIQGRNQSQMLSQSINYGAEMPPGELGPLSIVKGLFGAYPGYFSVLPYYKKVQEYSDLDQRDIWEYELSLTPGEIEALMRHAWELRGIASDYWFFDENCSFNLLFLIQAARPGLVLTAKGGWWNIPTETVRWIRQAGLIGSATYRPSRATIVIAARKSLPSASGDRAVALAQGATTVAEVAAAEPEPAQRAQTLDLAGEALHALAGRHAIAMTEYRTRLHEVLGARAALGTQPPLPPPPQPVRPDLGHGPGRFAFGVGREDSIDYATVALRAAQHDPLDPGAGYLDGASLTFGEIDLRWYRGQRPALRRLDAVRVQSLVPYEGVFRRFSWTAGGGLLEERMGATGDLHTQVAVQAGGGLAQNLGPWTGWAFATADARAFGIAEGYALGPGAQAGSTLGAGPVRLLGTAQATRYVAGWRETTWELAAGARWAAGTWGAVDVQVVRFARWERLADGIQVRGMLYF